MGNYISCPHCQGRGLVKTPENASLGVFRQISHSMAKGGLAGVKVKLNPDVADYLLNYKRADLNRLEERHKARVLISGDASFAPGKWEVEQMRRRAENDELKPGAVMGQVENGKSNGYKRDTAENGLHGADVSAELASGPQNPDGDVIIQ